jgi:pSer/pThr/pTyr-binding forkhead associated (FHA) protein
MASIVLIHEGVVINKFPVDKPLLRIGRHQNNDVVIDDNVVSMEHAIVEIEDAPDDKDIKRYYIKDLGSTNGTHVNGKKISRQQLINNDMIRIGWNTFKFIDNGGRKPEKTLKIHKSWIPRVYYTKE